MAEIMEVLPTVGSPRRITLTLATKKDVSFKVIIFYIIPYKVTLLGK